MPLVKVEGTSYVRDISSMALINTDVNAKNEYYSRARMAKIQKDEINTIKSEMDSLKNDVQDIKQLLLQLIDKGRNG